eukprot:TRINITY_DN10156_c0_g1_i3.p1 TRINITY_DN10156_c0_g1~~TRINITY_DN10156_c0_g1_i3.p1  ORF type:complete len:164 (+),score=16.38 TRINITY_DN10156_c0_g1_i3:98-589(+)
MASAETDTKYSVSQVADVVVIRGVATPNAGCTFNASSFTTNGPCAAYLFCCESLSAASATIAGTFQSQQTGDVYYVQSGPAPSSFVCSQTNWVLQKQEGHSDTTAYTYSQTVTNGGFTKWNSVTVFQCVNVISPVYPSYTLGCEIGRAVQQECRDRSRMPSSA